MRNMPTVLASLENNSNSQESFMSTALPSLGFAGIGLMGLPMCRRLLAAGYPLTVWNRSPDKCAALVAAGAR
ncbi:unnamed protein product, partial [marine sediment metagenome]